MTGRAYDFSLRITMTACLVLIRIPTQSFRPRDPNNADQTVLHSTLLTCKCCLELTIVCNEPRVVRCWIFQGTGPFDAIPCGAVFLDDIVLLT